MTFKHTLLAFTGAAAMTIAQSDAQILGRTLAHPPAGTTIDIKKIKTLPDSSNAWLVIYRRDMKDMLMRTNLVVRTPHKTDTLKTENIESAYYNAISHKDGSEMSINISRTQGSSFYSTQREVSPPMTTRNELEINYWRNFILEKTFQDPQTLPPRRKLYGYGIDNPEI